MTNTQSTINAPLTYCYRVTISGGQMPSLKIYSREPLAIGEIEKRALLRVESGIVTAIELVPSAIRNEPRIP